MNISNDVLPPLLPEQYETLKASIGKPPRTRCPTCGRQVRSLRCGHCGSRLPVDQAGLYGAIIKKLAKMGGNRPETTNKGDIPTGAADEELPKDDTPPKDNGDATTSEGGNGKQPHDFKRPFPDGLKSDEYYTPDYGFELLRPYLPQGITIWEGAWGTGLLAEHMRRAGFRVIGDPTWDFFTAQPDDWEVLCTNPPFSRKDDFLKRAYALGKPFAFLLPIEALGGGARNALFRQHGLELIIPSKRIAFSGNACNFGTAWFCWKIDLPAQLTFVEAWW